MPYTDPPTAPQVAAGLRTIERSQLVEVAAGESAAPAEPMRAAPIAAIAAATTPAGVRRAFDLVSRPSPAAILAQFILSA